jgi:hypothetical protein
MNCHFLSNTLVTAAPRVRFHTVSFSAAEPPRAASISAFLNRQLG